MSDAWAEVALSDVASLYRESVVPSRLGDQLVDHYSLPAFDNGAPERVPASQIASNKLRVPKGAVLASRLNPSIPRVWSPNLDDAVESICSTEFAVLTATNCEADFLRYFIESDSVYGKLNEMVNGTSSSHQRVSPANLMAMRAPLPPVVDQRLIVEVMHSIDEILTRLSREEEIALNLGLAAFDAALDAAPPEVFTIAMAATFHNKIRIPLSRMAREKRPGVYPYYGATGIVTVQAPAGSQA